MVFSHFARAYGLSTRRIGQMLGIQQAAVSNAARKGAQIAGAEGITFE
jgi:predicted transcriptional regulator